MNPRAVLLPSSLPPRAAARSVALLLVLVLLALDAHGQSPGYELARHFVGDFPSEANPGFHEDVQGVTHDDAHWFFTQTLHVWKVPVSQDLSGDVTANPGTVIQHAAGHPEIGGAGFDHLGGCGYHAVTGAGGTQLGYVAVAMTGDGHDPQIAIFRASDLKYLGRATLVQGGVGSALGVSPDGHVWAQYGKDNSQFNEYALNWEDFDVPTGLAPVTLEFLGRKTVRTKDGDPVPIPWLQGMTFSASGDVFYTSNGFVVGSCTSEPDVVTEEEMKALGGIRAIDTQSFTLLDKSQNGIPPFNYQFLPGFPNCEEPEGLTWWDLDDGSAPGITGTLHAILLDNDFPDDDDFYFKHYTNRVHVGGGFPGEFVTVQGAYDFAWDGAEMVIAPGIHAASLVMDKRLLLRPLAGTVVLGQ